MATTTPNYGWPVPTSTDYVKDGATAIEALGDAIDATVFGLGSAGLTLISTITLSGTSQTVNSLFSSTYNNYLIVSNDQNTDGIPTDMTFQFRTSSATTTTNYDNNLVYSTNSGGPTRFYSGGGSAVIVGQCGNETAGRVIEIYGPNLAARTTLTGMASSWGSTGSQGMSFWGRQNSTTQFTGLVIASSTTMSGTMRVYGYKN